MQIKAVNDPRPLHQPRRIDLPVQKGKRTESEQEKVKVAIVNNANNIPIYISEQFLQFGPSMSSYLKANGNLEQIRRTRTSMKGIIGLTRKLPSEKGRIKFSYQSLEGARFRDKFPPLNVILSGSKNGKISECTSVRPKMYRVEMRSKRNLHGMEHTNFAKSASRNDTARMSTKQNFFRNDVHKGEEYRDRLGDTFQRKVVHSRQWLCVTYDELSSLNHQEKKTTRQSNNILDIQTARCIVVSDTQTKVCIKELDAYPWIHLVKDSPSVPSLGRPCNEVGSSYSWPTNSQFIKKQESNRMHHRKHRPHGCSYQKEGSTIH